MPAQLGGGTEWMPTFPDCVNNERTNGLLSAWSPMHPVMPPLLMASFPILCIHYRIRNLQVGRESWPFVGHGYSSLDLGPALHITFKIRGYRTRWNRTFPMARGSSWKSTVPLVGNCTSHSHSVSCSSPPHSWLLCSPSSLLQPHLQLQEAVLLCLEVKNFLSKRVALHLPFNLSGSFLNFIPFSYWAASVPTEKVPKMQI